MGLCMTGSSRDRISMHVTIFQAKNGVNIDNAEENEIICNDYYVTSSGYLILPNRTTPSLNTFAWTKNFYSNEITRSSTIVNFKMEQVDAERNKIKPTIENASYANDFTSSIWNILSLSDPTCIAEGTHLEIGDVLKMGDQMVCFRLIRLEKDKETKKSKNREIKNQDSTPKSNEGRICFGCKGGKVQENNPLIKPCACTQSPYYHLNCINKIILSKIQKDEFNNITYYDYYDITCEYCESQLITVATVDGVEVPIVDPTVGSRFSYFFMEIIEIHHPFRLKGLLILNLEMHSMINLGRSDENELIFEHDSVSLFHGSIDIRSKGLFYIDKSSGSSSYLLLKNTMAMDEMVYYLMKIGNYIVEVHPIYSDKCSCLTSGLLYETEPYKNIEELLINKEERNIERINLSGVERKIAIQTINLRGSIDRSNFPRMTMDLSENSQIDSIKALANINARSSIRYVPQEDNLMKQRINQVSNNDTRLSKLNESDDSVKPNARLSMFGMPPGGIARNSLLIKKLMLESNASPLLENPGLVSRRSILGGKGQLKK